MKSEVHQQDDFNSSDHRPESKRESMSIVVRGMTKSFGAFKALNNVSLEIEGGSLVALLGPSGSGKTTLLRIIAGLETANAGAVEYAGEDVTHQAARDRNVGFVFQHYALFRHMTVFENIAFGLRVRKKKQGDVEKKVRELLHLVRLERMEHRYPSQLSGGQRQRIALARALAIEPKVLLLDEPFGALDAKVRQELRSWLRRLHDEIHTTSVLVTHDQEEAFEVADSVVVMNQGRIEQVGSPIEVFEQPATPFVMDFLGNVNVFHGRVQDGQAHVAGVAVDYPDYPHAAPQAATLYMRPHELDIVLHQNGVPGMPAQVRRVNPTGSLARIGLAIAGNEQEIQVDLTLERFTELNLRPGDTVFVLPKKVRAFLPEYVI
jgi:sulfate transport system ATP-binding protein